MPIGASSAAKDLHTRTTVEVQPQPARPGEFLRIRSGFYGVVCERLPNGGIGPVIESATITFEKEDRSVRKVVRSGRDGRYQVDLGAGRYFVWATHPSYGMYSSKPGFFVVRGGGYQTGNIFLVQAGITTVLLTRHYDYDTVAGPARARELIHVGEKARISAIFATNTTRSQETVRPLAQRLGLTPIIYNYPTQAADLDGLKNTILGQYAGKVVFVAGHSDTLHLIVQAFSGNPNHCTMTGPDEFDNLCVITTYRGEVTSVVNLQYGAETR